MLFLALAAPAHASTAMVVIVDSCGSDVACNKYDGGHDVPVVVYLAAAGEANRVVASRAGDEVTLSDPGASVTVRDGCRSTGPHAAICTAAAALEPVPGFSAQLGDGDDTLTIAGSLGVVTSLEGGPGDDALTGGDEPDTFFGGPGADRIQGGEDDTLSFAGTSSPVTVDLRAGRTSEGDVVGGLHRVVGGDGADRLLGGPGADTLQGGAGADVVRGGAGDDALGGGLGADSMDGGAGDDQLSGDPPQGDDYYTPRIHLSRDVLRGGPGNDQLRDSGGANRMDGGPGNDVLVGGAGADRLSGGAGRDRLTGGGGSDRLAGGSGGDNLLARDGRRDRVDCGAGRDRARTDAKDRVRACETLRSGVYTSSG